ncbi:MAG: hypothetical protein F6J93_17835 [Oscillatoria sp. SIO1A7]|nr:hypothetical protein [Oscillatoria sp. SIO1A7]
MKFPHTSHTPHKSTLGLGCGERGERGENFQHPSHPSHPSHTSHTPHKSTLSKVTLSANLNDN